MLDTPSLTDFADRAALGRFDVKILPNEPTNESQSLINHPPQSPPSVVQFRLPHIRQSILNTSNELVILSVTNLTGISVQRVQQVVNLSFISLVYQSYTVINNALEYTGIDEITKSDTNTNTNTNEQKNNSTILTPEMIFKLLIASEIKPNQPSIISRKQQQSGSQPLNEHVPPQQQHPTRHVAINITNKTLLLSSFGWLIIDEIH
ncbi:unnamed protein product [Adineta steineri]|uniref:Uncharacterized protein n=1 Tax=Adineta steineri TaxID=433720 RepID=A0A815GW80_9BILA|nr:unnamed protein product [Adineta steineri]